MRSKPIETNPELLAMMERAKTIMESWTPFQRALNFAQQRRSWVIGEMMLGDDGKEGLSRERAEALYVEMPEGALLAELERRMAKDTEVGKRVGDSAEIGKRAAHYGSGVQPWDHMKLAGWAPMFAAGNALKYVRRYLNKNGDDDLDKGRWYYHELIEMVVAEYQAKRTVEFHLAPPVLLQLETMLTVNERAPLRQRP